MATVTQPTHLFLAPRLLKPAREEANQPTQDIESIPAGEEMIYRGTRVRYVRTIEDSPPAAPPTLTTMTYRGTQAAVAVDCPSFPFGRLANLAGMIYRGTRLDG